MILREPNQIYFEAPTTLLEGIKRYVAHKYDSTKRRTSERTKSIGNVLYKVMKRLRLETMPLSAINTGTMEQLIAHAKRMRKVGNNRARDYHRFLHTCCEFFCKNEWLDRNPMRYAHKDRQTQPQKHKPYTNEQIKSIYDYIEANNPFLGDFIEFMVNTGLRPNEIRQLQVNAIDTEKWILRVRAGITKQRVARNIVIPPAYIPTLQQWNIENYPQDYYLFSNLSKGIGAKMAGKNAFSEAFKKVKNTLGIDDNHTLYSFRHTHALRVFESNGFNPTAVGEYLGHLDIESTYNYLRRPDAKVLREQKFIIPTFKP